MEKLELKNCCANSLLLIIIIYNNSIYNNHYITIGIFCDHVFCDFKHGKNLQKDSLKQIPVYSNNI